MFLFPCLKTMDKVHVCGSLIFLAISVLSMWTHQNLVEQ